MTILVDQKFRHLPSDATLKREFARVDERRKYAKKKEQAKKEVVALPLAGGELLLAAEQETRGIAALTETVLLGNLAIGHVQKAGEEQGPGRVAEEARAKHGGSPEIYGEAKEGEHVGGDAGSRQGGDYSLKQPATAVTNPTGDGFVQICRARGHAGRIIR